MSNSNYQSVESKGGVSFLVENENLTIRQISVKYQISEATIRARVLSGKTGDDLIRSSKRGGRGVTFVVNNEELTIREISKKYNVNEATLRARIQRGWTGNSLISESGSSNSSVQVQSYRDRIEQLERELEELRKPRVIKKSERSE